MGKEYSTDYRGVHEGVYRRRKAEGKTGWSSPEIVKQMHGIVMQALSGSSPSGLRFLELGCGDGSISLELSRQGMEVHGVDIVPFAIEWAREKSSVSGSEGFFVNGIVTTLPYRTGVFDIVLDADCSHCIIGRDRDDFFSEAFRVLRPGGIFVSSCMCGEPPPYLLKYFDPATCCMVRDGIAGRCFKMPEDILKEMENAGFIIRDYRTQVDEEGQKGLTVFASS